MSNLKRVTPLLLGGALCLAAGGATAAADLAKGKAIAANGNMAGVTSCVECHGAAGEGQAAAGIPRLAGLDAAYLQGQLVAFGSGTRENSSMTTIAKRMNADTMADLSAYFASLPAPPPAPPAATTSQIAAGAKLALRGDWTASIPPCASCHGQKGLGVGAAFPPIAAQSATYIAAQLNAWKTGTRHDDPLGLMRTVAVRLNDTQISAVAAYYETLPGGLSKQADKGSTP